MKLQPSSKQHLMCEYLRTVRMGDAACRKARIRMLTDGRDERTVRLIDAMVRAQFRAAEIRERIQASIAGLLAALRAQG